jgi:acetyl-CoA carboxylase beta subunit
MLSANVTSPIGMSAQALLAALKQETRFEVQGEPSGNLTVGRGTLDGKALRMAVVENRVASGSLSVKECSKLAQLFRIAAIERAPLLLFPDSARARVSEGLPALGAFRAMFAATTSCGYQTITRRSPLL